VFTVRRSRASHPLACCQLCSSSWWCSLAAGVRPGELVGNSGATEEEARRPPALNGRSNRCTSRLAALPVRTGVALSPTERVSRELRGELRGGGLRAAVTCAHPFPLNEEPQHFSAEEGAP
jgi:hypothetical protein